MASGRNVHEAGTRALSVATGVPGDQGTDTLALSAANGSTVRSHTGPGKLHPVGHGDQSTSALLLASHTWDTLQVATWSRTRVTTLDGKSTTSCC